MAETQQTVAAWMAATFPGADPDSPRKSLRALEEMVELCLASGATPWQVQEAVLAATAGLAPHAAARRPDQIPAETADVQIVLYGVAHMRGFDLAAEVDRKMAVNRARRWAARGDGTGYHVKEGSPP